MKKEDGRQLITAQQLGRKFGMSARAVNEVLEKLGWQAKRGRKWEPTYVGFAYAVLDSTSKLKWESAIVGVFQRLHELGVLIVPSEKKGEPSCVHKADARVYRASA